MRKTVLVAALAHLYLTGRVRRGEIRPLTARSLRTALGQFADTVQHVSRLNRGTILHWAETIGHLSPATRRNRWSAVHQFCTWMVQEGHLKRHPMTGLRAPRVPRSVPRNVPDCDVRATLRACPDVRAQLIVVLMIQQGLRRVEVARLEMGDMDLGYGVMTVRGKADHERILPITAETRRAMRDYLAAYPANAGPLIRSYHNLSVGVQPATVGRIVSRAMLDAGVKRRARDGVSGHSLRHTAAAGMLRSGAHVRDVQQVLGHAHIGATERYMPLVVGTLAEAMEGRSYLGPDPAVIRDRRLADFGQEVLPLA